MKKVAVSGYFSVIHKGHVQLFEEAKKLGDWLIVIINNNQQQIKKKGRIIHDTKDIKYIIERLKCVDETFISIDKDKTVCKSLEQIKPDIFANGGDRFSNNIPEHKLCKKLGIKMVFNIGGGKLNSSSKIIQAMEEIER